MSSARASLMAPEVIVEHVSAHGPTVTHVRGMLIASGRENLREVGALERYEKLLPGGMREAVMYAIASSWLPVEVAMVHYRTCEQLDLSPAQIARLGELSASRMLDTFAGQALRMARDAGADTYWMLMKRNDRLYDRMYKGGGVTVLQTGPKDVWLENVGQPLATCRFWRELYLAYMTAFGRAFTKASYVKLARPRTQSPIAIAISGSWV